MTIKKPFQIGPSPAAVRARQKALGDFVYSKQRAEQAEAEARRRDAQPDAQEQREVQAA